MICCVILRSFCHFKDSFISLCNLIADSTDVEQCFSVSVIDELLCVVLAGDCNDRTASSGAGWHAWLSVPVRPPESE